jgi:hypothetical protein
MYRNYLQEEWKMIEFDENIAEHEVYAISTHGRVKSYKVDRENGMVIKQSSFGGYKRIPLKQKTNRRTARYTHKLVAETFIEKTSEDQKYVIHLDYNKHNNNVWNLRWATKEEMEAHQKNNPNYRRGNQRITYSKLTPGRVKMIKRIINDPNRKTRMKIIARQFGVSIQQLYRIKWGENWGHIKLVEKNNENNIFPK